MTDREVAQRLNTALNNALDRAQVAERERDELKARIEAVRGLGDTWWEKAGPGSRAEDAYGRQMVTVEFAVGQILAALDGGVS